MSTSDTPAVSVSRPVDLETWERLARALIATRQTKDICERSQAYASASSCERVEAALLADFIAHCTPERILGLIGEVRRSQSVQEQKQDLDKTAKNQPQAPQTRGEE